MRFLFTYILFSLFALSVLGQNKIDSLEQVLKTSKAEEKAYIYYQLSKELYYKDVLQVRYYSLKADSLSAIYDIDTTRVNALNNLTYVSLQTGKVRDALMYNQKALELAERKNLKKEKIKSIFFKGYYLYATGQPDSSLVYLEEAYKKAFIAKESTIKMQCLNTMAANYLNQGKYEKALSNFTKAYEIADSLQLKKMLPNISLNIGTTLLYNEDLEQAIGYFENVIEMSDSTDVNLAYASALNNLGSCYSRMADHKKALTYFEKALPPYQQINNKLQIAQLYANLGQSNYHLGRIEAAEPFLNKAIELNRTSRSTNQLIINLIILGNIQLQEKEYLHAKYSLFEAKELVDKYNINYNKVDLYDALSNYFKTTNQFKKALDFKQKQLNYKDSIFNVDHQRQITELETKFQSKQKENENQILRKDLSLEKMRVKEQINIRNFLLALSLLIIILVVILLNRARIKKRTHKIIEKQKSELEKANNTKDKFFSIIAHDLKSPFSALLGFSELLATSYDDMDDKERKSFINDLHTASQSTYSLVENLLTWSRIQQGNLAMTKEKIDIFNVIANGILANQSTAKLKNIAINNNISSHDTIWVNKFSIETIIGNLVSNAIKFTPEKGSIDISTEEKNGMLIVSIIDTGVGMTSEQVQNLFKIDKNISTTGTNNETGTGLGLILCKEFIEQNDGSIWVKSELGKGSIFSFSVPIYK